MKLTLFLLSLVFTFALAQLDIGGSADANVEVDLALRDVISNSFITNCTSSGPSLSAHICPLPRNCSNTEFPALNVTTCCPSCRLSIGQVAARVSQNLAANIPICTDTLFGLLPPCGGALLGSIGNISKLTGADALATLPSSIDTKTGCPSCRWPGVSSILERVAGDPCNMSTVQRCILSRPICNGGQLPVFNKDSCCPINCVPPESVCRLDSAVSCILQQRVCEENEEPVHVLNQCCPSCRVPEPICYPLCNTDEICIFSRQAPNVTEMPDLKDSLKRQTRDISADSIVLPVCRKVRQVNLVLANAGARIKNSNGQVDNETVRAHLLVAIRTFCLHPDRVPICQQFQDVFNALKIRAIVDLRVVIDLPVIPIALEALANVSTVDIADILQNVVNNYLVPAVQQDANRTATAVAFALANTNAIVKGNINRCVGLNAIPVCNNTALRACLPSEKLERDLSTCCFWCRRLQNITYEEPPKCTTPPTTPCPVDALSRSAVIPRLLPNGCPHCLRTPDNGRDGRNTTRCTPIQLLASLARTRVCATTAELVSRSKNITNFCTPDCVRPEAKCTMVDRIRCIRNRPVCADDEAPAYVDGECCESCYRDVRPVCTPSCNNTAICVRTSLNSTTGQCFPVTLWRLRLKLRAAIIANITTDIANDYEASQVFDQLFANYEHADITTHFDSRWEFFEAIRDSVTIDVNVSASIIVRIPVDQTSKRGLEQSSSDSDTINTVACNSDSLDQSGSCSLESADSPAAPGSSPSATTSGSASSGSTPSTSSPAPSTPGSSPVGSDAAASFISFGLVLMVVIFSLF